MALAVILLYVALALFVLDAVGGFFNFDSGRFNVIGAGLACATLALILTTTG